MERDDHAAWMTWRVFLEPFLGSVRGGCMAISHSGFKDGCCPSEKPFGCLLGDGAPFQLIWSDSLKTLTAKPPFFPFPLASRATSLTRLPSRCPWCRSHLSDCPTLAEVRPPLPTQLLSKPLSQPFWFAFYFPFNYLAQFLGFIGRGLLAPPGEGDAQPCVHTHRAPERAEGAAQETQTSSCRGWCGRAEMVFLAWLGRLHRSLERMWCHLDPLR